MSRVENCPGVDARGVCCNGESTSGQEHVCGRILVVSGSRIQRDLTQAILEARGHAVVAIDAQAGTAAELAKTGNFDLIVVAFSGTGARGLKVVRDVRAISGNGHADLPILALASVQTIHDMKDAYEAGIDDILNLPVCPVKLCLAVEGWLSGAELDVTCCCGGTSPAKGVLLDPAILADAEHFLGRTAAEEFFREINATLPDGARGPSADGPCDGEFCSALEDAAAVAVSLGFLKLSGLCRKAVEGCGGEGCTSRKEITDQLNKVFQDTLKAFEAYRAEGPAKMGMGEDR